MKLFMKISQLRMTEHYLPKMIRCLEVLNEEQVWKKDKAYLNSIGGLVLHICEHIKRNTDGTDNRTSFRKTNPQEEKGIENFFPDEQLTSDELIEVVKQTFESWFHSQELYFQSSTVNSGEIDIHKMYHLIEHVSYHLGQIVDRTQHITGQSYQFCQNGLNERNLRMKIEREI
ncbi:hypothetical protein [Chengkuizengella axinellae]|uniref:DUF1572 domain-containing protein n=1 Tax=Chengkuizengella axinellae TaxID=3064388 RepID=A0ABT9J113_9BACL|nr:hypothetical protein [Chengkuizengella sp. 2205SS18-9]MDP5275305.1 hypothetical protein [Chengkuizengella sp. 2205SS18-9]